MSTIRKFSAVLSSFEFCDILYRCRKVASAFTWIRSVQYGHKFLIETIKLYALSTSKRPHSGMQHAPNHTVVNNHLYEILITVIKPSIIKSLFNRAIMIIGSALTDRLDIQD
jgi:hypothetical protein